MSDIENGQHWLDRNRPPRVQITYDVEIGDAVQKKELPLVVGILAHLDGNEGLGDFGAKTFASIDRDNFNEVLRTIAPSITLGANTIRITHMDQFHPLGLVAHDDLPDLRELYRERQKLRDMLAKLDGNQEIDALLKAEIKNNGAAATGPAQDDSTLSDEEKAERSKLRAASALQDKLQAVVTGAHAGAEVAAAIAGQERTADAARSAGAAARARLAERDTAKAAMDQAGAALADQGDKLRQGAADAAAAPGSAAAALEQLAQLYKRRDQASAALSDAEAALAEAQADETHAAAAAAQARADVAAALDASSKKSSEVLAAAIDALKPAP